MVQITKGLFGNFFPPVSFPPDRSRWIVFDTHQVETNRREKVTEQALTKLASIPDLGVVNANASTRPGLTSFSAAKTANLPKIHLGRRTDNIHQVDIDIGGPFATRWTQVGFLERPPGRVDLAKKSYRTCLKPPGLVKASFSIPVSPHSKPQPIYYSNSIVFGCKCKLKEV